MDKKLVILMPGFKTLMTEGYYDFALQEAPGALITNNFEQVRALIRNGEVQKVIIMHGAMNCASASGGQITAATAYKELKKISSTIPITVIDGWDWGIPGQIVVDGSKTTLNKMKEAVR